MTHIRNTDAIAHVVRFFIDEDVIHVNGKPNPIEDFNDINNELILSDISTLEKLEKRVSKLKVSDKSKATIKKEIELALHKLNKINF